MSQGTPNKKELVMANTERCTFCGKIERNGLCMEESFFWDQQGPHEVRDFLLGVAEQMQTAKSTLENALIEGAFVAALSQLRSFGWKGTFRQLVENSRADLRQLRRGEWEQADRAIGSF
jgi:hypothetical protein